MRSASAAVLAFAAAVVPVTPSLARPAYTLVPEAERLDLAGVFFDAALVPKLLMLILALAAPAAVAVWALCLPKVGRGDAKGVARSLGTLRVIRSAAVPLGFFAASYVLLHLFMSLANVRPTPGLTVMAPGFAEVMIMVMLGLFTATVAVVAERHLEARVRRAAA